MGSRTMKNALNDNANYVSFSSLNRVSLKVRILTEVGIAPKKSLFLFVIRSSKERREVGQSPIPKANEF